MEQAGMRKFKIEHAAQSRSTFVLPVDKSRILVISLGIIIPSGMLEFINDFRIPVMMLALNAVMDFSSEIELSKRNRLIRLLMTTERFFPNFSNANPFYTGGGAGEISINKFADSSQGLQKFGPTIRLNR